MFGRDLWLYIAAFLLGVWCSGILFPVESLAKLKCENCKQAIASTTTEQPHRVVHRLPRCAPVVLPQRTHRPPDNTSTSAQSQPLNATAGPMKWRHDL
jgi:hypothetical protein